MYLAGLFRPVQVVWFRVPSPASGFVGQICLRLVTTKRSAIPACVYIFAFAGRQKHTRNAAANRANSSSRNGITNPRKSFMTTTEPGSQHEEVVAFQQNFKQVCQKLGKPKQYINVIELQK
jgi:hypothetical protein